MNYWKRSVRAQRALAAQSGDDLQAYAQNVHQIVRDVEQQLGLKFRYRRAAKKTGVVAHTRYSAIKRPQIRRLTLSISSRRCDVRIRLRTL